MQIYSYIQITSAVKSAKSLVACISCNVSFHAHVCIHSLNTVVKGLKFLCACVLAYISYACKPICGFRTQAVVTNVELQCVCIECDMSVHSTCVHS